jgi:glucose/arabinose dehydrogenase
VTPPPPPSASGDAVPVGGTATVSVTAESVDRIAVGKLWTDWTVTAAEADGAAFVDDVAAAGRCRFEWETTRSSASVSIAVEPAMRYVGGTYGLTVTAGNPDGTAGTTATLDVEPPGTHAFAVETVATGLDDPWAIAFLPNDDRALVTERPGSLVLVDRSDGTVEPVSGAPSVDAGGQGGLLDATLHPDYPTEPWVYLTYAAGNGGGERATHLGRSELDPAAPTVENFEVLHVAGPFAGSNIHYGSRVAFGADGCLYVTSGDRRVGGTDFGPDHVAQDTGTELGAVLRLRPDGTAPDDNPFVGVSGAADALFSYGHRNPQGLAVHPDTGDVWLSEHGENDGDEVNVALAGENYGWPVATECCYYGTDDPVGVPHSERDDVVAPAHAWPCGEDGFPPGGATVYDGDAFPNWRGDLFVGGLGGPSDRYLARLVVADREAIEFERLLVDRGYRIREPAVAPDTGHLYLVLDGSPAPILRLVPA